MRWCEGGMLAYFLYISYSVINYHQVVDAVLEEVRMGMEINRPDMNRRRVSAVKYLGEVRPGE